MTIEAPTLVEDEALALPEEVQYLRWTPIVAGAFAAAAFAFILVTFITHRSGCQFNLTNLARHICRVIAAVRPLSDFAAIAVSVSAATLRVALTAVLMPREPGRHRDGAPLPGWMGFCRQIRAKKSDGTIGGLRQLIGYCKDDFAQR